MSAAAAATNQLALGVIVGAGSMALLVRRHRSRSEMEADADSWKRVPLYLVLMPVVLVTFRTTVVPGAAAWSRDRAIQHSAALIAEIEAFRARQGHYPVSLQSLHADIPTGVVGIERFQYEPQGDAYNLSFVRPAIQLDAMEAVVYNPRDEHRFTAHTLDCLQHDGEELAQRRGDRRRTPLAHPYWITILLD